MADPVTLGALAINVGCGLMTNAVQWSGKSSWERMAAWWQAGRTPENHDVLKATHAVYIDAMARMAVAANAIAQSGEEKAAAKALAALVKRADFADFRWDGEHLPLAETGERIASLFAGRHGLDDGDEGWRRYNRMIVADLAAWGVALPDVTTTLFVEGSAPHPPWHVVFREQYAELIKADAKRPEGDRAFRILTFDRLGELTASGAVIEAGIAGLHHKVDAIGADTAETLALLLQLVAASQPQATAQNVTDAALLELARRVADRVDDPQQALAELGRALDELVQLRAADARGTNYGDWIDEARRRAAAYNDAGAFDQGNGEIERAFAQLEDEVAERQQAKLALIERGIEQGRSSFDADVIAEWVTKRLMLENGPQVSQDALLAQQGDWYQQGQVRGLLLEIQVSVVLARRAMVLAKTPVERACAENALAIALKTQGERTGGDAGLALLADAVAAFRAALTVWTAEHFGHYHEMAMRNLARAEALIAERRVSER